MAVGASEDLPVHEPDVVAWGVLAIIGELDGRAAVMRFVRPGEGAFRRAARSQPDVAQGLHRGEVQETMVQAGHGENGSDM